jgi:4'-phosphopantetheinyl transferase
MNIGVSQPLPAELAGVSAVWVDIDRPLAGLSPAWLQPSECERANRFRFEVHRRRFIAARLALRALLGERLGLAPDAVPLALDESGKPRLAGGSPGDLRFNLSHSGPRALCAFARGREVGVDVEAVRALPDMEELALEVFSASELGEWRSVDASQRVQAFFNGWTRKEAFVKALGRGLDYPLQAFDVALRPNADARLLQAGGEAGPASRWMMHAWSPEPGYQAALVVETERGDIPPTRA